SKNSRPRGLRNGTMTDLPDDQPASDDDRPATTTSLPTLDSFAAVNNLIALAVDPKAVRRNLRSLHDALAATAAAQQQLESDRAAFAEYEKATRAEREGQVELANKKEAREDRLAEREQRIRELENAW